MKPIYTIYESRKAFGNEVGDSEGYIIGYQTGAMCYTTRRKAAKALNAQYENMANGTGEWATPIENTLNFKDGTGRIKFNILGNEYIRWVVQLVLV